MRVGHPPPRTQWRLCFSTPFSQCMDVWHVTAVFVTVPFLPSPHRLVRRFPTHSHCIFQRTSPTQDGATCKLGGFTFRSSSYIMFFVDFSPRHVAWIRTVQSRMNFLSSYKIKSFSSHVTGIDMGHVVSRSSSRCLSPLCHFSKGYEGSVPKQLGANREKIKKERTPYDVLSRELPIRLPGRELLRQGW